MWLAAEPTVALTDLNTRVYTELFLTPASDPWLGLVPADVYTALDSGGCSIAASTPPATGWQVKRGMLTP